MKNQKGYTLTELIYAISALLVAGIGLTLVGVVIWALVKLVTAYT